MYTDKLQEYSVFENNKENSIDCENKRSVHKSSLKNIIRIKKHKKI